ncbi:enhancer of mRNA-decapping protein 3 [Musca vetustissima]|uniref:enhancer of mRNA-decapping protein 3 n=1 Tax=Musca vetustissima TaxID=27455 RepID=UPI002AB79845|nr:enhancer of mRNA-decapping protein 3 [Musca vetustissima]
MEDDWTGKAVSIECDPKLGVFQGIISQCTPSEITIVRAFRNGVPLRKQDAEVTLRSTDINKISLLPSYNNQSTVTPTVINKPTPVKQPNFANVAVANGGGGAAASGGAAGVAPKPDVNSTLSNKLKQSMVLKQESNILSPTSSRAPSAQQQSMFNGKKSNSPQQQQTSNSVALFFGNLIPPKVEVRMGAASCSASVCSTSNSCNAESYGSNGGGVMENGGALNSSKPIDIVPSGGGSYYSGQKENGGGAASYSSGVGLPTTNGRSQRNNATSNGNGGNCSNNTNGNGNGARQKQRNKQVRRENSIKHSQTFSASIDDPLLHEDFDFEGNLALFDKQAIWDSLEAGKKPDLVQHTVSSANQKKYRHDENILVSEPAQMRQIESLFDGGSEDFVTDEGLIIPTIPIFVRTKIEMCAQKCGLSLQRQLDLLARGATDLAILLLGGARRLTPNNRHQWPTIAIICEKSENFRSSNVGAATGRQLASHGLKVLLYLEEDSNIEQKSIEISLFKATGNTVVYSVEALPTPDLVILSTNSANLSTDVKKWLSENRASILAIDPPPSGINDVSIKYSIIPILPLNGISSNNCGKLYLCNLGIPDKFYRDAGIKYKSPFGHKFVIPIHSKD